MIPQQAPEPGKPYALALTFLVHAGLIAALFLGVQWKRSAPDVMEVELWAARPVVQTAPPPPEPVAPPPEPEPPKPLPPPEPPPPPKAEAPKAPDIALKDDKKKPEPKKPEPPKPDPRKPEPPKPEPKKAEAPKVPDFSRELMRESADLKPRPSASAQQLANAAAAEAEGRATQRAASNKRGLADYASKVRNKIRGNIILPPSLQGNPEAIFEVNQLPTGEVLSVKLKRSSGNPTLDAAIERAIIKSSPLPLPTDPSLFQRDLEIKYKPFEE